MSEYFGKNVFKLGFGLMRLPKLPDGSIDIEQTSVMVDKFIEAGAQGFIVKSEFQRGNLLELVKEFLGE